MTPPPIAGFDRLVVVGSPALLEADERAVRRGAQRGTMKQVRSGVYVPTPVWNTLRPADRERLAVAAAHAGARSPYVASHRSAGALWGVPAITEWDGLVDARVSPAAGTRTEHGTHKHAVADSGLHLTTVLGVPATTLERTIVDRASSRPFAEAVVAADWALKQGVRREDLLRVLAEAKPGKGHRRAEQVIAFADPLPGSPAESWSRVQMFAAALPCPRLQVAFSDARGLIGYVDFFWPEFGVVGEFDGFVKLNDPAMRGGRTPAQVAWDEKRREDRIRALGFRVVRWTWADLVRPGALVDLLADAGVLPPGRSRTSGA